MFEHLLIIPCSEKVLNNDRDKPLTARWLLLRGTDTANGTRFSLDWLKMTNVVWSLMHYVETLDLSRIRHCTLATSKLGHTYSCINQKGFWDNSGTWTHSSVLLHMRIVVRHEPSGNSIWWWWTRLFHMGFHGPALQITCLNITSTHIHTCFLPKWRMTT